MESVAAEEKPRDAAILSEMSENIVPLDAAVVIKDPIATLTSSLDSDATGKPAAAAMNDDFKADV